MIAAGLAVAVPVGIGTACVAAPAPAVDVAAVVQPQVEAPSAALLETGGHTFLYTKAADEVRPPASMAKIMTLVLALEAVQQGRVHWNDFVPVSDEAYRTGGSQIWLEPGEVLPFRQLVLAVAVASANDAAVAVAEHLAGSVAAFVAEMNAKARAIGMTHTRFVNPNGLDAPGTVTETTARDMALLGDYATRVPGLLRLAATREDRSIRDGKGGHLWLVNHNRKLLAMVPGADGIKTGYTSRAGYCVTATAKRGGLRLVAVVMGDPTANARNRDAAALLNWGFAHYRAVAGVTEGETLGSVPVRGGTRPQVAVAAGRTAYFTVPSTAATGRPTVRLHLPGAVSAPVRQGRVLGTAEVALGDRIQRVPLIAKETVQRAGPWDFVRSMLGIHPATPGGVRP